MRCALEVLTIAVLLILCQCAGKPGAVSSTSARALSSVRLQEYRTIASSEKGDARLKSICARLLAVTSYHRSTAPRCRIRIVEAPQPLALSIDGQEIILSHTLYSDLSAPGALFFVVAHEYAHLILHHTADTNLTNEIAADALGIELTYRAGLPLDDITSVLALANHLDHDYESFTDQRLAAALRHPLLVRSASTP